MEIRLNTRRCCILSVPTNGRLLKPETIEEMFKPQLTDQARAKKNELIAMSELNRSFGGIPLG